MKEHINMVNLVTWESIETYPCDEAVWGSLAGKPIRHHKFPDSSITHHHDSQGNIYPIGVRLNIQSLYNAFLTDTTLTADQKNKIAAIKIVRSNRANTKSVIAFKGLLYNVGLYTKQDSTYFYPNYPYNDLRPDPFINASANGVVSDILVSKYESVYSNSDGSEGTIYSDTIPAGTLKTNGDKIVASYSFNQNVSTPNPKLITAYIDARQVMQTDVSGFSLPTGISPISTATINVTLTLTRISITRLEVYAVWSVVTDTDPQKPTTTYLDPFDFTVGHNIIITSSIQFGRFTISQFGSGAVPVTDFTTSIIGSTDQIKYNPAPVSQAAQDFLNQKALLNGFADPSSQQRYTFHSPDTSFYQPFLGNVLKLESVEYGTAKSHFTEVKNHVRYKFPSLDSYLASLAVGVIIGFVSGTYGVSDNIFNGTAAFTAFTTFNDIIYKVLPRTNFCYQFNSLGDYSTPLPLPNDSGNKIRQLDIATYLISGMQSVGDINTINNYQRESSVYLRTTNGLPYPDSISGIPTDESRFTLSQVGCNQNFFDANISSYYGSIKTNYPDQYGQIYSYSAVDTGFQLLVDFTSAFDFTVMNGDIFGGDTFINKFALKRKMPFFLDNRVNPQGSVIYQDGADIFYDQLGNVGYPTYWFSTDIQQGDGGNFNVGQLFGVAVNNFDCKGANFFYNSGKIYLFAYGIPYFFVESEVNTDMRQAVDGRQGDYYPHVSGDVPDDWLQETNVPIAFDNSYNYNKTYSKQNIENNFTTLPVDFIPGQTCQEVYPNKAIYSDVQQDVVNYKKNNWLIYRPASYFDFPLNYGKLISLDGIDNGAVLARFENKSMLYNTLLTLDTSNPQAAYLGNGTLFKSSPPVDFAETDLGYVGSQNKFLLKTEYGIITADAKRGQVFLINGQRARDIGDAGLKQFLMDNLNFFILNQFPNYNIDNNFKGVGLHGVYDTKYDRFIMTKLDYMPIDPAIVYDSINDIFTLNGNQIVLGDPNYFCNMSFTLSYWFETQSWISFHSYLPNYYVGSIDIFYSGIPGSNWQHNTTINKYNNFYGQIAPYILEIPYVYKSQDEIIQSVSDYSKVNKVIDTKRFVQTDNNFFNKAWVYNDQQHSGELDLVPKPINSLASYMKYPIYNTDSKSILYAKSDNFYNYNGFWDIVNDYTQPIFTPSCVSLSFDKVLNTSNMNYTNRSYKKYPIRGKDARIRHILDNTSDVRITSQFTLIDTQISYK